jgi:hypothetical protein
MCAMNASKLAKIAVLCVIVCVMIGLVVDQACAQKKGADKDLASKEGLNVLDGKKKSDPNKGATTLQKSIGVASVFVMIAVVKWL